MRGERDRWDKVCPMKCVTQHPIHAEENRLKRALTHCEFRQIDNGEAPELVPIEQTFELFNRHDATSPLLVDGGRYALRSDELASLSASLEGSLLPLRAFAAGKIYDGGDRTLPCHNWIEGVVADQLLTPETLEALWRRIVHQAYDLEATCRLAHRDDGTIAVVVTHEERSWMLATLGKASSIARVTLHLDDDVRCWFFAIDVDDVAQNVWGFTNRSELYSPIFSPLAQHADDAASFGDPFYESAVDTLRSLGFCEFYGRRLYETDCYKKMNMIQEAWDVNNRGIALAEPSGTSNGLPTVLTPALEEALATNWKADESSCRLFEVSHVFLPGSDGEPPIEKRVISFGGYGSDLDREQWLSLVGEFFNGIGIFDRRFVSIPFGRAPAYADDDGWIVTTSSGEELTSTFGTISPVACENHGIGTEAFMAQFEYQPLHSLAPRE